MHRPVSKLYNRCRFCMNEDELNLMPLSIILDEQLTIFDVEQITGLEDLRRENKPYMVCDGCDRQINMCLSFRNNCRKNDLFFEDLCNEIIEDELNDCTESTGLDTLSDNGHASMALSLPEKDADTGKVTVDDDADTGNDDAPQNHDSSDDSSDDFTWDKPPTPTEVKDAPLEKVDRGKDAPKRRGKGPRKPKIRLISLCPVCGKFVTGFFDHLRRHANETPHACPYCDKKMNEKGNLLRHINSLHLKQAVGRCEECDMSFYLKVQHKTHMLIHHGQGRPKIHKCKHCPKMFSLHSVMRNHMERIHFPQRKHACPICGLKFKGKADVNNHRKTHSDERAYGCRFCPKKFKASSGQRQHEKTHSGEIFKCDQCEKSYRYKVLLKSHVKKCHPDSESCS